MMVSFDLGMLRKAKYCTALDGKLGQFSFGGVIRDDGVVLLNTSAFVVV